MPELKLNEQDYQIILKALGKLPLEEVLPTYNKFANYMNDLKSYAEHVKNEGQLRTSDD